MAKTTNPAQDALPYRVLVVCTGNICRSAMAHSMFLQLLGEQGLDPYIDVSSGGTWTVTGAPAAPLAIKAMQEIGFEPHDHASRELTARMVGEADLVLAAAADHRSWILREAPAAMRRTFTIGEFDRLLSTIDPDDIRALGEGRTPREALAALTGAVAAQRTRVRPVVPAGEDGDSDDIDDPYGRPYPRYQVAAERLAGITRNLVTGWTHLLGDRIGRGGDPFAELRGAQLGAPGDSTAFLNRWLLEACREAAACAREGAVVVPSAGAVAVLAEHVLPARGPGGGLRPQDVIDLINAAHLPYIDRVELANAARRALEAAPTA